MSTARELFLNRKDVRSEVVKLDIGGGQVLDVEVRAVSLAAADRIDKAREKSPVDGVVQFILEAVFDPETGKPLFERADAARLKELTQPQVAPLSKAYERVTKMTDDAAALGKDSAATPAA